MYQVLPMFSIYAYCTSNQICASIIVICRPYYCIANAGSIRPEVRKEQRAIACIARGRRGWLRSKDCKQMVVIINFVLF